MERVTIDDDEGVKSHDRRDVSRKRIVSGENGRKKTSCFPSHYFCLSMAVMMHVSKGRLSV